MSNGTLKQDFGPVLAGLKNFPSTPDQLIPMLQYVQAELGYLAPETMAGIADYLRLPMSHVYGVATFYAQFRFRPLGKNRLTVCRGTACHVRGSARLAEEIERMLGIKAGSTTADMLFSLETVACLGSCALAPAVVVNDKVHGKMTTKKMQKIIDDLRGGTGADRVSTPPHLAAITPPEPVTTYMPAARLKLVAPPDLPAPPVKNAKKAPAPRLVKSPAAPAARPARTAVAKSAKSGGKKATAGKAKKTTARPAAKKAAAKTKPARPATRPAAKPAPRKSAPGRKGGGTKKRGGR